eukprot:210433-Alexandrium_andersonii.AAC.1
MTRSASSALACQGSNVASFCVGMSRTLVGPSTERLVAATSGRIARLGCGIAATLRVLTCHSSKGTLLRA